MSSTEQQHVKQLVIDRFYLESLFSLQESPQKCTTLIGSIIEFTRYIILEVRMYHPDSSLKSETLGIIGITKVKEDLPGSYHATFVWMEKAGLINAIP